MTGIKPIAYLISAAWLFAVGVIALGMTHASKRGREREEQMDRDEREGEE